MATSPTFHEYLQLSEPFFEEGKFYIHAENPSTGNSRKIRWYTETEVASNYNSKVPNPLEKDFPLLIIRNVKTKKENEWCKTNARYKVGLGYHFTSSDKLPNSNPTSFQYVAFGYSDTFSLDDRKNIPLQVARIIDNKIINKEFLSFL